MKASASQRHGSSRTNAFHGRVRLSAGGANRFGRTQVSGDGAYDTRDCYDAVLERDAVPTLLPRRNAKPGASREQWRLKRDAILKAIEVLGRYEWRVRSGTTRQSLAENAVSRWKTILGPGLAARGTDNQTTEAMLKAAVLNRMVRLGMPESVRVMA